MRSGTYSSAPGLILLITLTSSRIPALMTRIPSMPPKVSPYRYRVVPVLSQYLDFKLCVPPTTVAAEATCDLRSAVCSLRDLLRCARKYLKLLTWNHDVVAVVPAADFATVRAMAKCLIYDQLRTRVVQYAY